MVDLPDAEAQHRRFGADAVMGGWDRSRGTRENVDRAILHAGRLLTRRARLRYERPPTVELGPEHVEGAALVPNREALVRMLPTGAVGAELGVDEGEFTARLIEVTHPALLYLIDPWASARYGDSKFRAVGRRFAQEISAGRVQIERASSLSGLARIEDGSLDWAYVDTDHTYTTTLAELQLLDRKVKEGGVIAGHDYVTGNWLGSYRYGVVEAVNRFCVECRWRFVGLTHESDRHLSFALRRLSG